MRIFRPHDLAADRLLAAEDIEDEIANFPAASNGRCIRRLEAANQPEPRGGQNGRPNYLLQTHSLLPAEIRLLTVPHPLKEKTLRSHYDQQRTLYARHRL